MSESSSSLADKFYRTQLVESKITVALLIAAGVVLLITLAVVFFTIRGHYLDFVQSPYIGSSFGYMVAFSHTYPFLAPLFFKNPNTPDIVINVFYANQGDPSFWTPGNGLQSLVDPTSWRDKVGTIVWYAESNRNYGYDQVFDWAQNTANLITVPPTPTSPMTIVNSALTYGLPVLNTIIMVGMLIAA